MFQMAHLSKINVIIGGGTGLIGSALQTKLLSKNIGVKVITRNPKREEDISWKTVKSSGLPQDTDVIVNLSGRNIGEVNPSLMISDFKYRNFMDEVRRSRIETTMLLVEKMPESTKLFINASAIGYYKSDLNQTYTEESEFVDYNFLTHLVRDWEEACSGPQLAGVRVCFLRTGIVLSKDGGVLSSMYMTHRFGLGGPIGGGNQWFSWIHLDDLVNLYYYLIADPAGKSLSGPVNGTAPNPVRQKVFSKALSESLGAPFFAGYMPTPSFVVRAMLGGARAPLLLEGQRVLPAKAQAAGFRFAFPTLEEALKNIYGKEPLPVSTQ